MDLLFKPILGVRDTNDNNNDLQDEDVSNTLLYVNGREGLAGLQSLVDSGSAAAAFSVRSVSVQDILDVADAGLLLPPKATFFSPKPKVGLISRLQR